MYWWSLQTQDTLWLKIQPKVLASSFQLIEYILYHHFFSLFINIIRSFGYLLCCQLHLPVIYTEFEFLFPLANIPTRSSSPLRQQFLSIHLNLFVFFIFIYKAVNGQWFNMNNGSHEMNNNSCDSLNMYQKFCEGTLHRVNHTH